MLIAGYPGIGKSTLALSAPKPLHVDVDFGIERIEPQYRVPYIQPKSYDEILNDLVPANLSEFESVVFDTGGKLLTLMSQWAIKKNPKYGQSDGSLSLKGYGFVGREFIRLFDYCFYELDKNVIIVFHAIEDKDGDNTRLRIKSRARPRTTSGSRWTSAASSRCRATTALSDSPTASAISQRAHAAFTEFANTRTRPRQTKRLSH